MLTDFDRCYDASRMRDDYCHICIDVRPYVHKANGDSNKKAKYMAYLAKRRKAGYRTPSWFIEDEEKAFNSSGLPRGFIKGEISKPGVPVHI